MSNVNAALSSLRVDNVEETSQSRFNISEYGQSPIQIYAFLQCRADATVDECNICSRQAKIFVVRDCANYVGSRVWSKLCFLRYNGNYNFTRQNDTNRDTETNQHFFYNIDPALSPGDFVPVGRELLYILAFVITSGSSRKRYASKSTIDTLYHGKKYSTCSRVFNAPSGHIWVIRCEDPSYEWPVYTCRCIKCSAACWVLLPCIIPSYHLRYGPVLGRYIPWRLQNMSCLSRTIDRLFEANDTTSGARGLTGNCVVQYDMKSFFNDLPQAVPPPSLRWPQNSSSSKIPIFLGVLGGLIILLLMVGLFATRARLKSAIFGRHMEFGRHMHS